MTIATAPLRHPYAVAYVPVKAGGWRAYFLDFPEINVDGPDFGTVKARIAEAGRDFFDATLARTAVPPPRQFVVGYAHLDHREAVCLLDSPVPAAF